jgi:hypothetical protein
LVGIIVVIAISNRRLMQPGFTKEALGGYMDNVRTADCRRSLLQVLFFSRMRLHWSAQAPTALQVQDLGEFWDAPKSAGHEIEGGTTYL